MDTNILQIVRSPNGGIRKHILTIIEGIRDNNITSHMITDLDEADKTFLNYIRNNNGLRIFDIKIKNAPDITDFINIYKVYKYCKMNNINVVHGHGAKGGLYARVVSLFLKIKVIYTPHGGSVHDMHGNIMNLIYSIVENILYYLSDVILFESKYTMQQYAKKVKSNSKKYKLNSNSIKIESSFRMKILREFPSSIKLCSIGLLREIKGHDLSIKAVSRLINEGYDVKLDIYGEGTSRSKLQAIIDGTKNGDRIKLLGETNDPLGVLSEHNILIHAARFESFGYVPLEAIYTGVTVVSSLSGGLREVLDNGNNGFCFNNTDNELELYKQIKLAIENKELREKKFENAKAYIIKNFDEEVFLKNIKNEYLIEA